MKLLELDHLTGFLSKKACKNLSLKIQVLALIKKCPFPNFAFLL